MTPGTVDYKKAFQSAGVTTPVIFFPTAESSNTQAKILAADGAVHGTAIVVGTQTHGRGRQGRVWDSAESGCLSLSVVLRPDRPVSRYPLLALGTAVAVASVLGEDFLIKWPNDILTANGHKVAGVLSEADLAAGYVVVGIGVNINQRPASQANAACVRDVTGESLSVAGVAADIVARLLAVCDWSDAKVVEHWRGRDATMGRSVRIGKVEGYAMGIDDDGALRVERIDGTQTRVLAGDVELIGQM